MLVYVADLVRAGWTGRPAPNADLGVVIPLRGDGPEAALVVGRSGQRLVLRAFVNGAHDDPGALEALARELLR